MQNKSRDKTSRVIKTLSPEQADGLVKSLTGSRDCRPNDSKSHRNLTMVLFMLDAGLRVNECRGLLRTDIVFQKEPVLDLTLRAEISKNHKQRVVPLTARLREAIRRYEFNCWRQLVTPPDQPAFWSTEIARAITCRQIQRIVADESYAACGVTSTPHMLRHTCATNWMRKANARVVQELLGHSSLSSTQVYTHPDITDLRAAVNGEPQK